MLASIMAKVNPEFVILELKSFDLHCLLLPPQKRVLVCMSVFPRISIVTQSGHGIALLRTSAVF